MKCNNCNYEGADFTFCPNCGAAAPAPQPQQFEQQQPQQFQQQPQQQQQQFQQPQQFNQNYGAPVQPQMVYANGTERILAFFKDTLFMVVAILFSASVLCSVIRLSFPVIEILFTIFFWLIFVAARKNNVRGNQVRWLSGTTFAKIIVQYVSAGLVVVVGLIVMAGVSAVGSAVKSYGYSSAYSKSVAAGVGSAGVIVLIVCIVVAAITVLLAIFGIRPIHKMIQSAYQSLDNQNLYIVKARTAKTWLMVFGILKGLGAIGSLASGAIASGIMSSVVATLSSRLPSAVSSALMSSIGLSTGFDVFGFLGQGALAAAYIILSLMVGKYLADVSQ